MSDNNHPSSPETKPKRPKRVATVSEDLAHGQIVIVIARWILVLAGLLLALWNPEAVGELRIQILVILLLAIANFYLQAQLLMRRPVMDQIVYAASAADLVVITVLIITAGGYNSSLYIFYFPAILAFSVAFSTTMTGIYALGTISVYGLICISTAGVGAEQMQIVLSRLIMIAAVAYCGNLFWRIEKGRRQEVQETQSELMSEIMRRQAEPVAQS